MEGFQISLKEIAGPLWKDSCHLVRWQGFGRSWKALTVEYLALWIVVKLDLEEAELLLKLVAFPWLGTLPTWTENLTEGLRTENPPHFSRSCKVYNSV